MKICIDPGHGGSDPGAVGKVKKEKDLTLAMAKRLAEILKELGAEVRLTRESDVYVPLSKRYAIANEWGAKLFISIHCNSATSEEASGIETLCYSKGSESGEVANSVQNELIKATGWKNRGVKERPNLAVLRGTDMPAVLVETGFISNAAEEEKLSESTVQEKLMLAVSEGVLGESLVASTKPIEEETKMIYQRIEDVPEWGKSTIQKLVDADALQGTEDGLGLTEEMLRIFVVLDRMNLFG